MSTPDHSPSPAVRGYVSGRFRIDLPTRQLLRDGEAVAISARAWDALVLLLANRARVVSKDELLAHVWPDKTVSDDVLPQTVLTIRRALGDDSGQPRFVATIPRRGYRFIAPAAEISSTADAAAAAPVAAPLVAPEPAGTPDVLVSGEFSYRPPLVAAAIAIIAVTAAATWFLLRGSPADAPDGRPLRFTQSVPAGTTHVSDGTLSPDGRSLAFIAEDEQTSTTHLWVRSLDAEEAQSLVGTQNARRPFWSPDSRAIGFFVSDRLKIYSFETGSTQALASVGLSPAGATWGPRGQILFAAWRSALQLVPATGGAPTPVTKLNAEAQEVAHQAPQFLPGGDQFLYYVVSVDPAKNGTYLGHMNGAAATRLLDGSAVYAEPGYLIWTRDGALLAQRLDLPNRRVIGDVKTLAANVAAGTLVSSAGRDLLAFGGGGLAAAAARLRWFNRHGQPLGVLSTPTALHNPALSADHRQLVASSGGETEQRGLWLVDLARGAPTRLVTHGNSPIFSPDRSAIVYTSAHKTGINDVYRATADGRDEQVLLRTPEHKIVNDWSPDGRLLVFVSTNSETKKDIWLLPADGTRTPIPYVRTKFNEIQGRVSPDGRWMAYASDESGEWEVYVQKFPATGQKQIISVGGGAQPYWRADGRELFYLSPTRSLMSVDVVPGDAISVSKPTALFRLPIAGGLNTFRSHYVVDASGERILVDVPESTPGSASISVIVNWQALLAE